MKKWILFVFALILLGGCGSDNTAPASDNPTQPTVYMDEGKSFAPVAMGNYPASIKGQVSGKGFSYYRVEGLPLDNSWVRVRLSKLVHDADGVVYDPGGGSLTMQGNCYFNNNRTDDEFCDRQFLMNSADIEIEGWDERGTSFTLTVGPVP